MKKIATLLITLTSFVTFAQFTTGTISLTPARTIKIDTDATTATMTLTGPDTSWLGIGFGATSMLTVTDMFIWNSSTNRDYTPSGAYSSPSADAPASQSWTIVTDNPVGGSRTIVATRALVSAGDFTFLNDNSDITIIYNQGLTINFGNHGTSSLRGSKVLTRSVLGIEDFSLNATQIYPNPSKGDFVVKTKSGLDKINVYSHVGAFVKTININSLDAVELNIGDLSSGVYLLELVNKGDKSWKKVVLE